MGADSGLTLTPTSLFPGTAMSLPQELSSQSLWAAGSETWRRKNPHFCFSLDTAWMWVGGQLWLDPTFEIFQVGETPRLNLGWFFWLGIGVRVGVQATFLSESLSFIP